jgi:hypothetical protein
MTSTAASDSDPAAEGNVKMGRLPRRLSQLISGYVMAVKTSARGRWLSVPLQALRIVACRLFYRFGTGPYCLYRFDRKPVRTWRTYIYDARAQQRSINPGRILVDDKIAFHRECLKHGLRTVAILGLFVEKSTPGSDDDPPLIRDPAHLQRLLEANPDGLFVKFRDGAHGEGAFAILPHSGNWRFPGGIGTAHDAFEYCVSCAKTARANSWIEGDNTLLVQPRLITVDALRGVMAPDAFATIRAVTYMHDQRPTLMAALLKIVVEGNAVDNFGHGATGNLLAPLDPLTGTLTAVRGSRSRTWPVIFDSETHPTTGIRLVGVQVPRWSDVLSLVLRAQACFAGLRTIGWDVGITQEGPLLVEGNAQYDFDLLQVAFDRGFALDFERVMLASQANSLRS